MNKALLILSALLIGVLARWLPHPPNFSPIIAIAIFMGLKMPNRLWAAAVPLAIMFVTDLALGFYSLFYITYAALAVLAIFTHWLPKNGVLKSKALQTVGFGLAGSIWFYLTTNAAAWWSTGIYTKDFSGLLQSYVAGIPFFQNTMISSLAFTALFMVLDKVFSKYFADQMIEA